jgi:membrane complex biogenesis BtpA family protein
MPRLPEPGKAPLFSGVGKPIIAMIHVAALPGTPRHELPMREIVGRACAEARIYREAGVQALMIENMHDVPYLRGGVGPEIVAGMTLVAQAVRAEVALPMGLQILAAADLEALSVAHVAGLNFIRVECFSFAHVADEGVMQSNAARLLRYRRQIGAEDVQVWADIKKKHASHALTADLSVGEVAEAARFMGADAVIVTGTTTGRPPSKADVAAVKQSGAALPVLVGSGVSAENAAAFLDVADGVIVGSHFKRDGHWANPIDPVRVLGLLEARGNGTAKYARKAL